MSQTKWEVEEVEDKLGAMVLQVDLPAGEFPSLSHLAGGDGAGGSKRQTVGWCQGSF